MLSGVQPAAFLPRIWSDCADGTTAYDKIPIENGNELRMECVVDLYGSIEIVLGEVCANEEPELSGQRQHLESPLHVL